MTERKPVNITLSESAIALCRRLQAHLGVNRSAVIEMAVRDYAKARDIGGLAGIETSQTDRIAMTE